MGDSLDLQIHGPRIYLAPIFQEDHEHIYRASFSAGNAMRWRFHGQVPDQEAFVKSLYEGTLSHFVIRRIGDSDFLGCVNAYAADLRSRHCHVGAVLVEEAQQAGLGIEALKVFIRYIFDVWDFMGVYAEVPEYVLSRAESATDRITAEIPFELTGKRPRFHYQKGRHWDDLIVYLPVEKWRQSDN